MQNKGKLIFNFRLLRTVRNLTVDLGARVLAFVRFSETDCTRITCADWFLYESGETTAVSVLE